MTRNSIIYALTILLCGTALWWQLQQGGALEFGKYVASQTPPVNSSTFSIWQEFDNNLHHPLSILILQILVIIATSRFLGFLMVKIGQPTVIGEIAAGILLGPSLVGWLFPSFSEFVFPKASLGNLQFLSQIGLILFMFIIGMELDLKALRKTAKDAIVISHASIAFSYFLGVSLAYFLYENYAPDTVGFTPFALFMGIAMSISAFPVLARIVHERGLTRTPLGITVIACAAADDLAAWCILAVVIAIAKAGTVGGALMTVFFAVAYIFIMLYALRPFLERIANRYFALETLSKPIIAIIFGIMLVSAYIAEVIGIHALYGAFLAGVIMPSQQEFRHILTNKIEDVSLVLLLPLFFVITGIRTEIGLLNTPNLWILCGIIIAVAVCGKFLGSTITARLTGQTWENAFTIGALMNTRGLMELVVLNIGYDLGILTPSVFAMMVLMALSTTFMTAPALNFIHFIKNKYAKVAPEIIETIEKGFKVLISFGQPKAGERLLQLAYDLGLYQKNTTDLHALHLTPSADISMTEAEYFEKEGFAPIKSAAEERHIALQTHYKATNNLNGEIIRFANTGDFDLMLVGSSRPLFSDDETGGMVHQFFETVHCPLGVLIDKGFASINSVLAIVNSYTDLFLLNFLNNFNKNKGKSLTLLSYNTPMKLPQNGVTVLENEDWKSAIMSKGLHTERNGYDLIIMSNDFWESVKEHRQEWAGVTSSILIVNKP